jgi:hypothetical protein
MGTQSECQWERTTAGAVANGVRFRLTAVGTPRYGARDRGE